MAYTEFMGGAASGSSRQATKMRLTRDLALLIADDDRFWAAAGLVAPMRRRMEPEALPDDDVDPEPFTDDEALPASFIGESNTEPPYMQGLSEREKAQVRLVGSDESRAKYASELKEWKERTTD